MFKDILEDNIILVVPNNIKDKVLKYISSLDNILNIKIMSLDNVIDSFTFTYDERSIYYLMKKYKLNYEVSKVYLENIKYIQNENYNDEKLKFLLTIKEELLKNNLLIHDNNFRYFIKNKKVIIYGYDYIDNYSLKIINELKNITEVKIIEKKYEKYVHKVYEFNTIEEEIDYVASKICDLISDDIDINKIKITGYSTEYSNVIRRIFNFYNIPINLDENRNVISSNIVSSFFEYLTYNTVEESLKCLCDKYDVNEENNKYIYEKIIDTLNRYNFVKEEELLIEILKNELKNISLKQVKLENSVDIIDIIDNIIDDDNYVFMIGFNMGNIPKIYKDEEYLSDLLKEKLNVEKSYEKNKIIKRNIINNIENIKNLTITYKLKSDFDSYIPSILIDELNLEIIKNEKAEYKYSKLYNEIKLSNKLDNLIKYGNKDDDLNILYNSNKDVNYLEYDNKFKGIDKIKFNDSLSGKLLLSYSSLDNYNRCSFRYYLNNILKITEFEETFAQTIGTMFHDILSRAFNEGFDFEKEYEDYKSKLNLTNKDNFFLKKLKEELKFVIDTINMQNSFNSLDKTLYENKVYINKDGNIKLTFMGIIDKIMYKEENNKTYLVIIDYKTGLPHTNLNNTIYGIDMQLPVYLYLTEKGLFNNAEVIGFYLQKIINNEINKVQGKTYIGQKKDNLKLLGYTINEEEKIKKFDFTYTDSEVIKSLKISKNGFYSYSKVISKDEINKLVDIVEKNINEGFKNILDAKFDINPKRIGKNNVGCEFCKYKDICYVKEEDIINLEEYKNLEFLK